MIGESRRERKVCMFGSCVCLDHETPNDRWRIGVHVNCYSGEKERIVVDCYRSEQKTPQATEEKNGKYLKSLSLIMIRIDRSVDQ